VTKGRKEQLAFKGLWVTKGRKEQLALKDLKGLKE